MNTTQDIPRFCTAYQLDQRIHRLAALCKMYGIEVDRLQGVELKEFQQKVKPVFDAFNERARLWQRATGRQWLARGFKEGSIFFEDGNLMAAYMDDEHLKGLLQDSINGITVDSMIRRRERQARLMSARWQVAGVS